MNAPNDELPFSPAAERNRGPILEWLAALLPAEARVLEIASGTGQHAAFFAAEQRGWSWQPSEADARLLDAIGARCRGLANVRPPVALDVASPAWPLPRAAFDAVYCANLVHIAPWPVCAALMRGASAHLRDDGMLVLYGPFHVDGEALQPGNAAFDADLQARDARWGLRRLADVEREAAGAGLHLGRRVAMPANNLVLVFDRDRATRR